MSQAAHKTKLRRLLLQKRQSMTQQEWQEKSDRICFHLQSSSLFFQAKTVLSYFSVRQEPELSRLFTINKSWGLPRCVDKSLTWHLWNAGDDVQIGAYNIPEPHARAPLISVSEVDLILVPAIACDTQGYRLGYGGGFYDRLLSCPEWMSKPAIGITFDFAYLEQLPVEAWDKPLDGVCTETGLKMMR
ncbi:5-formyltetrahydrofolate cyclo-ligase [Chroococcidiopsis sp. TS-821]|uniref:5-formyltetrahydrofolate cyclo-ligase n=1 Tax=Chroococcidiopsis sp. TS-821 TaxID=1378066 RepID=UPI000CEEC3C5|nr:5-formyltetrahydrofolate cyclo-ligase [Chroococcidiopsis sp. TS-821]